MRRTENKVPYIEFNYIKMPKTHYIVCFAHKTSKTHGLVFKIMKKPVKNFAKSVDKCLSK